MTQAAINEAPAVAPDRGSRPDPGSLPCLQGYVTECGMNALEHGFTGATFGEEIALIHSELSEALEEYRKFAADPSFHVYKLVIASPDGELDLGKPEGIAVELADVLIRVFDLCWKLSLPIEHAIKEKMLYNRTRSFRHGNKKL